MTAPTVGQMIATGLVKRARFGAVAFAEFLERITTTDARLRDGWRLLGFQEVEAVEVRVWRERLFAHKLRNTPAPGPCPQVEGSVVAYFYSPDFDPVLDGDQPRELTPDELESLVVASTWRDRPPLL